MLRKAKLDAALFAAAPDLALQERCERPPGVEEPSAPARADGSADQLQQLAHQLFLRRSTPGPFSLGLAAATPGEGTSMVACRLASEAGRATGQATLLLEANVHRPSQAKRMGVEPDPGLRRLLSDCSVPLDACLRQTALEHLSILPGGAAGAFSSSPDWSCFRRVFQAIQQKFTNVVVDLPPLSLSADSLIISSFFDSVVLVVQADLCSREVIQNAVVRLRRANPNVIGTILNRRKFFVPTPLYRRL